MSKMPDALSCTGSGGPAPPAASPRLRALHPPPLTSLVNDVVNSLVGCGERGGAAFLSSPSPAP